MTTNENFTAEVERLINSDRRKEYGEIRKSFGRIADGWSMILGKEITEQQVCLCMIWIKMCREIVKSKHDNAIDMAGYAYCLDELNNVDKS